MVDKDPSLILTKQAAWAGAKPGAVLLTSGTKGLQQTKALVPDTKSSGSHSPLPLRMASRFHKQFAPT